MKPFYQKQEVKQMRRYGLLWIALALCLTLCACSSGTDTAAAPDVGEEIRAEGGTLPAEDEGVPVSFWYAASGGGADTMAEILAEFNASQDLYTVKPTVFASYTAINEALQTAIASGQSPDLAVLERDISLELSAKKLTLDLTDFLRRSGAFRPEDFLPVYYEQGVSPDGRIFAMPFYGTTQVLYYNKAAFRAAGIAPESLTTWRSLADAARTLQEKGICDYGWEPMWGYENLMDAAFSNGGKVFSDDGRTVTINSTEWVEVWESFRVWLHEDRIMRIHSGGYGWEYWYHTMADALDGSAGGYTGSSGDQADVDFDVLGMLEQPTWREDCAASPEAMALLLNVLRSDSEERMEGACALLRYLVDVHAQAKWTMGSGYIAVNRRVTEDPDYTSYLSRNEYAGVPQQQSAHASVYPPDPTGGVIRRALKLASDRVEIENIPAQDALDEAQRTAQRALDEVLSASGREETAP